MSFYDQAALLYGYPAAAGSYSFTIKATNANNCVGQQSYTLVIGGASLARTGDFDGDGKADMSVFRGAAGNWLLVPSGSEQLQTLSWGATGEGQVAGDYDGDGKADVAVFNTSGHWQIKRSSDSAVVDRLWGLSTDVPAPDDYDGDGKMDLAVWRGASGYCYIINSSNGALPIVQWGLASEPYGNLAVPGDCDGDKKTDLAVFRRSNGTWYIKRSSDGALSTRPWDWGRTRPCRAIMTATARRTLPCAVERTAPGTSSAAVAARCRRRRGAPAGRLTTTCRRRATTMATGSATPPGGLAHCGSAG